MHRWLCQAIAAAVSATVLLGSAPAYAQTETQLTNSGSDLRPSWSPDGTLIMFDSRVSGNLDVWTVPVTGGLPTQQTFNRLTDQAPDWNPAGTAYVFAAVQGGGNPNIFTRPFGGGAATLLHSDPSSVDGLPEWSPDGTTIVYTKGADIYTLPATGGTPTQVTTDPANDTHPTWSPDGTQIAFQSSRNGNIDVYVIPATGGTETRITFDPAADGSPSWSPDGTTLAIQSQRAGNNDIWTLPAGGGVATQITTDPGSDQHPAWSPDGTGIVFARDGGIWIAQLSTPVGADLAVGKSVDDASPDESDTIQYTVSVTNGGPDDATGVELTDALPAGVTYVSSSASQGSYNSGNGVWTVGTVNNAGFATLTITATVDNGTSGQTISNTASVTASDIADPNSANDSASAALTVGAIDLSVTKTVDITAPGEGDTVVYTVTVDNAGPNDATGVEVTDLLPAGVTFVFSNPSQGSYSSGTGVWTVGDVDAGSPHTLDITVTVDAGTSGSTITNTASVSASDQADPNAGNDSDSAAINPSIPPDAAVQFTTDPAIDTMPTWSPDGLTIVWSSNRAGSFHLYSMPAAGGAVTQLTFGPNNDEHPDFSEDGTMIAFDSDRAGNYDIWTIPSTGGTPFQVNTNPTTDRRPAWSPDGSEIAFDVAAGGLDIYRIPSGGGQPIKVTQATSLDTDPHYTQDGNTILFDSDRAGGSLHVFTIPTLGGTVNQLTTVLGPNFDPAWSPDNQQVAFTSGRGASQDIWVMPAGGEPTATQITNGPGIDAIQTWSPDGTQMAFVSDRAGNRDIWIIPVNGGPTPTIDVAVTKSVDDNAPDEGATVVYTVGASNVGALDATGVEVTDLLPAGVTFVSASASQGSYASGTGLWTVGNLNSGNSASLTLTATVDTGTAGQTISNTATATASNEVDPNAGNNAATADLTVNGGTVVLTQIGTGGISDQRPAWSPDGTTFFFDSNRSGNRDLWTMPATGGTATRFTFNSRADQHPSWAPDGSHVLYSAVASQGPDIYSRPIGGGAATLLHSDPSAPDRTPVYSPDGTQIAFDKAGDIYVMPAAGGSATQLTSDPATDGHPTWSADGTQIAFESARSGNNDIWIIPAAGGTPVQLTTDGGSDTFPDWSPDGTTIAFQSDRDGGNGIWVIPAAGGTVTKLTDGGGSDIQPDWAPDGSALVFVRGQDIWTATYPGAGPALARARHITNRLETADTVARTLTPPVVEQPVTGPTSYSLATGAPNPFRSSTKFQFALPNAGRTDLIVYDVSGRRVKTLLSRDMEVGRHEISWDGRDENGRVTAPGVYFVRIQSGKYSEVKKSIRLD